MKIIREAVPVVMSILGEAKLQDNQKCRMLKYVIRTEHDDGTLLYNVLTKSIVLLNKEEVELISELPGHYNDKLKTFADLWYLVSDDNDDKALSDGMKNIVMALDSGEKPLTSYTIFTTTDCNARCFYCFEYGSRRYSMSEQTAHDVAAFIIKNSGKRQVSLHWFGGEPLFNSRVIDIICADLKAASIEYRSSMISNGYLFDKDMVNRAVDLWHLKRVQITLDGTEYYYNRRKAYIYSEGNPYQRVINNIGLLSQACVSVNIRLNIDLNNAEDIQVLCDELCLKFNKHKFINIYVAPIFENEGSRPVTYSDENRIKITEMSEMLQKKLYAKGMTMPSLLTRYLKYRQCMADSEISTTILPDGRLGRCEHYTDSETYGCIYDPVRDYKILSKWQEVQPPILECEDCNFYPECVRLLHCPNQLHKCTLHKRKISMFKAQESLRLTYLKIKED